MVLIKPVSSLSIRRVVDIYTFIALLGFGIFLFFLASERFDDFEQAHIKSADKATQVAAREVKKIIEDKRRVVEIFSKDNRDLISTLSQNPEVEELHNELNGRIRRNIPDFFASNIVTSSGELVIGDFDARVGDLCLSDMKNFVEDDKQSIRVHPNIEMYHYDILTLFPNGGNDQLFFVSFNLDEIANLLDAVQPSNHQLMLINKEVSHLIEVVASGGRNTIAGRLDYRLTGDEKIRIMSSRKVDGTMWHVVDLHEPELLKQYIETLVQDYLIVYFMFALIAFYMRYVLVNEDRRRYEAECDLKNSNEEIKKLNNKLERLSVTDGLTGLYNRRYIDERLIMEWSRCQRAEHSINIALIDVDYFKKYNDHYGHLAGDECLTSISNLMMLVFKRAGDVVARYGGEEFIVVMTDINAHEAEKIILQFQQELESMKIIHEKSLVSDYVTVSVGLVSLIPKQPDSLDDSIKNADKALYEAKSKGRNQIVLYKEGS
jgi:diguanylate cyclase (GGDEF)-like protein